MKCGDSQGRSKGLFDRAREERILVHQVLVDKGSVVGVEAKTLTEIGDEFIEAVDADNRDPVVVIRISDLLEQRRDRCR